MRQINSPIPPLVVFMKDDQSAYIMAQRIGKSVFAPGASRLLAHAAT